MYQRTSPGYEKQPYPNYVIFYQADVQLQIQVGPRSNQSDLGRK